MNNNPPKYRIEEYMMREPFKAGIVGAGRGCAAFLHMVDEDKLGRMRIKIIAVADVNPEAPGIVLAKEMGIPHIVKEFNELYDIEGLNLIIELTGNNDIRNEIERTRPTDRIRFIDHFGASIFWELYTVQDAAIRQRTQMREEVDRERRRVIEIFNSIPDEIVVMDPDQVVQEVNHSFLENNGLKPEDVIGKHCYDIDQQARGHCKVSMEACPFYTAVNEKKPHYVARKHFDAEGNARYAAIVAAPILDPGGEVTGIIESTRDITHRIRLEEELRATEGMLNKFMEVAPLATYVKNPFGQYLELNQTAARMFQREKKDILGKTDLELFDREYAELFRSKDAEVLKTGKGLTYDCEIEVDGHRRYWSTHKYPMIDANGKTTAVVGLTRDVTELEEVEEELTQTQEYLQNILDNSPLIIITTDLEGKVVSFNPGAEQSLGYRAEEIKGKKAGNLYHTPEERERLLQRVLQDGAVSDYETYLVRKDGTEVPVSITLAQLKDYRGRVIGTVGMSRDITHRKALFDQVMQSERLAAVGRLAAGVAHEINNPLAVIYEISEYLNELLEDDPKVEKEMTLEEFTLNLPSILKQVKRCRVITSRLLNFSRKSEARVEITDVNASLREVIPFLEKKANYASVKVHLELDDNLPKVQIEEMQLQEIFINLLNNSIQALQDKHGGNIRVRSFLKDEKVHVAFEDDGPGISQEVRGRLFDPFVSTKPAGEGTGLGLSICYGIVKRYDGQIAVESTPGQGATFSVILPMSREGDSKPFYEKPND